MLGGYILHQPSLLLFGDRVDALALLRPVQAEAQTVKQVRGGGKNRRTYDREALMKRAGGTEPPAQQRRERQLYKRREQRIGIAAPAQARGECRNLEQLQRIHADVRRHAVNRHAIGGVVTGGLTIRTDFLRAVCAVVFGFEDDFQLGRAGSRKCIRRHCQIQNRAPALRSPLVRN